MRPLRFRTLSIALFACFAFAGVTGAQTRSSAILNAAEVQQLITRAEPGDHARLGAHFAALAERYTTDARRHTAMGRAYTGNRNASLTATMQAHCTRLADLATQSAVTVRALAADHERLAAGALSAAPRDGARVEGGAAVPEPTEKDVSALAVKASTPADHRALEEYFLTLAKRYTADAEAHVTMARTYRGTRIAQAATHCERLAMLARDAAKEASNAAAMHKQLAGIAR